MKHNKLTLAAAFVCALAFVGSPSSVHATQITNILASGDSDSYLYLPIYAVNGAGLSGNAHTSNLPKAMWLLSQIDGAYFVINLKKNYSIETLKVWNYNQATFSTPGIRSATFSFSTDSLTFTEETNVTTDATNTPAIFDQAPGADGYTNYNTVAFNTSPTVRYIKITVNGGQGTGNYGDGTAVGLSEVQAFGTFVSDPTNSLGEQITVSNVTASSTFSATYNATNLINGSGLTGLAHDTDPANMWFSTNGGIEAYVDFDLGVPRKLGAMRIWNHNYNWLNCVTRGMRTVDILVSDDETFTTGVITNHNDIELLIAPAIDEYGYDGPQIIGMDGVEGRYVRISTVGNSNPTWGDTYIGLSEVQFFKWVPPPPPSGTVLSFQ